MPSDFDDLFQSPDHYLHSFDEDAAVFVPMDRAAYHRSIFLDGRISTASAGTFKIPATSLAAERRAIGWIFHIAHCGSTLLARALDRLEGNLVLREPLALRQMGIECAAPRLAATLAMLGKRYRAEAPTIVKANVPVNFILPEIVASNVNAAAIFLHCSLRDYLLAVLRTPDHRRWVRQVTGQLARYFSDLSPLSDAERAAALWLAQMSAFQSAMAIMPNACSLDAELFFAEPRPVLKAAALHLEVTMSQWSIDAMVAGSLFSTNAKNPALAFDNAARVGRRGQLGDALAPEIDQAQRWVERAGGGILLDRPLV